MTGGFKNVGGSNVVRYKVKINSKNESVLTIFNNM